MSDLSPFSLSEPLVERRAKREIQKMNAWASAIQGKKLSGERIANLGKMSECPALPKGIFVAVYFLLPLGFLHLSGLDLLSSGFVLKSSLVFWPFGIQCKFLLSWSHLCPYHRKLIFWLQATHEKNCLELALVIAPFENVLLNNSHLFSKTPYI